MLIIVDWSVSQTLYVSLVMHPLSCRCAKLPPRPPGVGQGITAGDVSARMVRLAGLMFDRINLEQVSRHVCVCSG